MRMLRTYLVEDSPLIRDKLAATLEELAPLQIVGSAENEAGALRWLAEPGHGVDLVIVDLFLKGGSGLGVLRAPYPWPHQPKMIVLSNYATADMRGKCLELGADQVFDKSHEIEALIEYCRQLAASGVAAPP
jgi:DNA-binding NarL/FixJ family response regulator